MIHYISPYSTSKNIGGAINLAIESLVTSDEDWIVHVDQDVMFLLPDSKATIEHILHTTGFDILGPVTNRLGSPGQILHGFFDVPDINVHIGLAKELQHAGDRVVQTPESIAAMVMCFKVKTWKELGRFTENTLNFDLTFCGRAKRNHLKLGIMAGVYVFHLYRLGQPGDAKNNYSHLLRDN